MEIELHEINVTLSKYQKEKICKAFHNREKILLRLKNDALRGTDTLLVPSKSLKRMKDDAPNGSDTILDKSTFFERMKNDAPNGSDTVLLPLTIVKRLKNDTFFVNSTTNESLENYHFLFYPTVVERLESKRKNEYKGMTIFLDYSLITDLTKDSVTRNIEKLIECGVDCH